MEGGEDEGRREGEDGAVRLEQRGGEGGGDKTVRGAAGAADGGEDGEGVHAEREVHQNEKDE